MFNDDEDEDDFLFGDPDPVNQALLEELYQKELEKSMRFAYVMIEQMGIEIWSKSVPYGVDRKLRILENMIHWYEKREEYEKCAVLVKGIPLLKDVNK
jgi:hypothetical protein